METIINVTSTLNDGYFLPYFYYDNVHLIAHNIAGQLETGRQK